MSLQATLAQWAKPCALCRVCGSTIDSACPYSQCALSSVRICAAPRAWFSSTSARYAMVICRFFCARRMPTTYWSTVYPGVLDLHDSTFLRSPGPL
jgi:hypothetical protein